MKIKYLQTSIRSGPGVARQLGLEHATSDWIWFQDDDDEIYNKTSLEDLLKIAKMEDYNNLAAVTGQTYHINDYNNSTEISQTIVATQGSIMNRKMLIDYNIHFEPELSFKEEDGTFVSLFLIKLVNKKILSYDYPVYLKKWIDDHISITQEINTIDSILNLMGSKAFSAQYSVQYSLPQDYGCIISTDTLIIIPNLINSLLNNLKKENKKLTLKQYERIKKYIQYYFNFISYTHIQPNSLDINQFRTALSGVFNADSFYGELSKEIIYDFPSHYQEYLNNLKSFIEGDRNENTGRKTS